MQAKFTLQRSPVTRIEQDKEIEFTEKNIFHSDFMDAVRGVGEMYHRDKTLDHEKARDRAIKQYGELGRIVARFLNSNVSSFVVEGLKKEI